MADQPSIPADPRFKDERGKRFGRWRVTAYAGRIGDEHAFTCICDCGAEAAVVGKQLRAGRSTSCGCYREDVRPLLNRQHGVRADHPAEYHVWKAMIQRCESPTATRYNLYGGRGIKVCDRWHDVRAFVADMGPRPSDQHSIERQDRDGDYEPGNCIWARSREQNQNTSRNVEIEVHGERMCIAEAARRFGVHENTLRDRLKRGVSPERAIAS